MSPTTWNDQPAAVEALPIALSAFMHDKIVEIRSDGVAPEAFVSVGNLFGSQTLRCDSLFTAVRLAHAIAQAKKGRALDPPPGTELLPNVKKGDRP